MKNKQGLMIVGSLFASCHLVQAGVPGSILSAYKTANAYWNKSVIYDWSVTKQATYNYSDWSSLTKSEQTTVLGWQTTLDQYNNGVIGPGHCS